MWSNQGTFLLQGMKCNSSIELRSIMFMNFDEQKEAQYNDMYVLRLTGNDLTEADKDYTNEQNDRFTIHMQKMKKDPMFTWTMPFIVGEE